MQPPLSPLPQVHCLLEEPPACGGDSDLCPPDFGGAGGSVQALVRLVHCRPVDAQGPGAAEDGKDGGGAVEEVGVRERAVAACNVLQPRDGACGCLDEFLQD
eukprot:755889-Hanusia_phi.AAC.5